MMSKFARCLLTLALAAATAGCASHYTTAGAATDYNRSFAQARMEMILLNILRASEREPLQFSVITGVSGSVHNSTKITIPFNNILLGGDEAINPSLEVTTRNPAVAIGPLETRDFFSGILQPVAMQRIDDLTDQGWNRAALYSLTIGGVECGGTTDNVHFSHNEPGGWLDNAFRTAFNRPGPVSLGSDDKPVSRVRLPTADALKLLREGGGAGREIRIVQPNADDPPLPADHLELAVYEVAPRLRGLVFPSTTNCPSKSGPNGGAPTWGLFPRSVFSMFRFVGAVHRANPVGCDDGPDALRRAENLQSHQIGELRLVRIHACQGTPAPVDAFVSTSYRGRTFHIRRDDQLTIEVLELLSLLTALQTSESSVSTNRPVIAVPAQ